ncbi:MAG TPA: glycosyltransferase [Leptolyngbyaceae cyanobacterium M33_DOE_097]|uniref:Glycosyltransferase n=1 Tax=Oscillatoriales cyanobacterium SpSt-418 TaxID=2282169 RepID=A0A7C3PGJ5_9CYAN|nr:glycosyltransferase [Leptolyngbyaceae cyanobacterium M33_DOE_097]
MSMPLPFISIVIPTYNRPERLKNCLAAIAQLDYPRDRFEVIIVDDGSEVPLDDVVADYQNTLNLLLIRQANAGPASARNRGAAQAKGEYLVFTDDDCMPHADWLTKLANRFAIAPDALVGGYTINALPDNLCSTASQVLIDYLYHYYNQTSQQPSFFASNNFAMPTSKFRALQGFDVTFPLAAGEDREFCDRWLYHHNPMLYAPDVQIQHAHQLSLRTFWRQHFNYGRGAYYFHQIRSKRNQAQIKVEPFSFYFNLLTYPLRHPSTHSSMLLAGLLFLSQVANVAGFFWERSQHQPGQLNETSPSVH